MSKNLTYLGIQNPFESDESKHHFKTYLAKYAEEVIRLACNRFTKLPKVGTLQEKCSRFKKKISQGSHNNCCTVCKRIYLQRIKPYQLARSYFCKRLLHFIFSKCLAVDSTLHYALLLHRSISMDRVKPHKTTELLHCKQKNLPSAD